MQQCSLGRRTKRKKIHTKEKYEPSLDFLFVLPLAGRSVDRGVKKGGKKQLTINFTASICLCRIFHRVSMWTKEKQRWLKMCAKLYSPAPEHKAYITGCEMAVVCFGHDSCNLRHRSCLLFGVGVGGGAASAILLIL